MPIEPSRSDILIRTNTRKTSLLGAAVLNICSLLAFTLCTTSQASATDIALLGATTQTALEDLRDQLGATGRFNRIDIIPVRSVTPTLEELRAYDAVLVWSNSTFVSYGTPLGNVLDDYIDEGGGVVVGVFSYSQQWRINGDFRFKNGGYYALLSNGGGEAMVPNEQLGEFDETHPVMAGVTSFANGTAQFMTSRNPHPESTVVAELQNGDPLVVERVIGESVRIDLAFNPLSSDLLNGSWDASTDGLLIIANALEYVVDVPSVTELLEALILQTAATNAKHGILNSLDAKLANTLQAWTAENVGTREDVLNKLYAYINAVEAQRGKAIGEADADALIDSATEVVERIIAEAAY